MSGLLSLAARRCARLVSLAMLAGCTVAPSAAFAQTAPASLLEVIRTQAPDTVGINATVASPDGQRVAVSTQAQAPGEPRAHDELWVAETDGTRLTPIEVVTTPGSGTEYGRIGSVHWSVDSRALAYVSVNPAAKLTSGAVLTWLGDDGSVDRLMLGAGSTDPVFTRDGRYLTFLRPLGSLPTSGVAHGAVDLASRAVLSAARVDFPGEDEGSAARPSQFSPECARAEEPGWTPALADGPWMERALSSPDPGCRFGANAGDPLRVDVAGADDAPANITAPAPGTGLVPINDRVRRPGPTVRIRSSAKGLSRALRRGVRVSVDLAGATSLKAYLIGQRPAGERWLGAARASDTYTVGRLSIKRPPSQRQTIAIPILSSARPAMQRFLKITVIVRLVATDAAGNRTVVERPVGLTDY